MRCAATQHLSPSRSAGVGRDSTRAAVALPRPEEVLGGLAERITHRLRHELQAEMAEQTADACRVAEKQVYIYSFISSLAC